MTKRTPYIVLAAAVVAVDQITKVLVDRLMALHESREIVPGLVNLTYVRNRGAAFGILSDAELPFQPALFTLVSVCALAAIAYYSVKLPATSRLPQTGLALIMGGAVGNLLNRAFLGYVIDFVDVYWARYHWPAFNVADSSISVGVGLLILDVLVAERPAEPERVAEPSAVGRSD
jgi:signal peptidase II